MKELLRYWHLTFYTDVISCSLAIIGFIVSILKRKQNTRLSLLSFFFLGYILDEFVHFLDKALFSEYPWIEHVRRYTDFIQIVIEFLVFFLVIRNYISSNKIKKALNFLLPVFLGSVLFYFIYYKIVHSEIDQNFLQTVFTIQASLLFTAGIIYYLDLFTEDPVLNLISQPSFWAVTGLSFFMMCTLPFSFLMIYLAKVNYLLYVQFFSLSHIFYCILFLMVIKAYFCKPSTIDEDYLYAGTGTSRRYFR